MLTRPRFGEGRCRMGKEPLSAPILIYRGNEDGMSGRYRAYRGRPVPDAGSRPVTVRQELVRAGVGEGYSTVEVPETGWREGLLLLACF